jgi:hypothetical protein
MAINTDAPKTRRSILAAALGGAGAVVAQALGRPSPVAAISNGNVQLGHGTSDTDNDSALETRVRGTTDGQIALSGSQNGSGIGLYGLTNTGYGIRGTGSASGTGVLGETVSGTGVAGTSSDGTGVDATSTNATGVRAQSTDSTASDFLSPSHKTGVLGSAGDSSQLSTNTDEVGVYGYCDTSANSVGVIGVSHQGIGALGVGPIGLLGAGGWGVLGDVGPTQIGVYGNTGVDAAPAVTPGIGVLARAQSTAQLALRVLGRVQFSRSGRTAITAGHASKVILMAGVSTASYVIATPQTNRTGLFVQAVVPAAGKFTIYLNKTVSATTYIGYLVIN